LSLSDDVEIDLEPGEKHDEQKADRAEQLDHRLVREDLRPARPDQHADDKQPDQARHRHAVEDALDHKHDQHDQCELEDGVLQRQGEVHHAGHLSRSVCRCPPTRCCNPTG
jgi:hypothetical protein